MKKVWKVILIVVIIGLVGAAAGYFYVFHKPHRDIAGENAQISVAAGQLVDDYVSNPENANARYLDQVIEVEGVAVEVTPEGIKLEEGIYCNLLEDDAAGEVQEGNQVKLKGRVVGYDELFGEVKLDNCQLVTN